MSTEKLRLELSNKLSDLLAQFAEDNGMVMMAISEWENEDTEEEYIKFSGSMNFTGEK